MFESSTELAENKLLVLYTLQRLNRLISNSQLTEILLQNNLINYFTLQQCISELDDSHFIHYDKVNEKNLLEITKEGENVLSFFKDRISPGKIDVIDNYIKEKIQAIKKELTIQGDYIPTDKDTFLVELKAFEESSLLMNLKIAVPNKKQAISLCAKWKNDPSKIYNSIISLLFVEDSEEES